MAGITMKAKTGPVAIRIPATMFQVVPTDTPAGELEKRSEEGQR